jgi:hypothetical protein
MTSELVVAACAAILVLLEDFVCVTPFYRPVWIFDRGSRRCNNQIMNIRKFTSKLNYLPHFLNTAP